MKKHLYLWLTGVFLILSLAGGCSSGGGEDIPSPPPTTEKDYINSSTDSFQSFVEGGKIGISFTTNQTWTASSDQSWCNLSQTTGSKGTVSFDVTLAENTTPNERTVTITVKAGTVTKKITITQPAADPVKLELNTTSFSIKTEGQSIQIPFTTNQEWTATSDQSWCTLSAASGDRGNQTLTVTIEKNTTPEDRMGTITLKAGTIQKTLSITQERQYQLKIDYDHTPIDHSGGSISVKVQCNTQFEMSCDATWLHQVKNSASRSMKEQTILFEADFNNEEAIRETEITFFNTEKNLKETIKIKQEAKPEDNTANPSGNIGNMTWG